MRNIPIRNLFTFSGTKQPLPTWSSSSVSPSKSDLREKLANNIYFLISDQGVLLKATSSSYLRTAEEEIDRFFNAKIEQLEVAASSDFYEHILNDIK